MQTPRIARLALPLLIAASSWLAGCAVNLSSVKFEEQPLGASPQLRSIKVQQKVCEVERQLALYLDEHKHLWLACPYRYEGRIVPLVAYIGPDTRREPVEFTHANAVEKIKTLKAVPLRACGQQSRCADLSAHGYFDFNVFVAAQTARVQYVDLSSGLKDAEAFYAQLDGRSAAPTLDRALTRLIDPARVAAQVRTLQTLEQHRKVSAQLEALGLDKPAPIATALAEQGKLLQAAAARQRGDFQGYSLAHQLTGQPTDLEQMQKLAQTPEQKSQVFRALAQRHQVDKSSGTLELAAAFASTDADRAELASLREAAERARQAELRRQDEARQAEARRQDAAREAEARRAEAARQAQERERRAKADEERCLRDAGCRKALEARRAQCNDTIRSCRAQCDSATGSGSFSGLIANLGAAMLARGCYAGCKCDSGFGDLLTRFNLATSGSSTSAGASSSSTAKSPPAPSAPATSARPSAAAAPPVTSKASAATLRPFDCKIYCKSASGPSITRRIDAESRQQAARIASDRADGFCAAQGLSKTSDVTYSESQCIAR